jgi:hypothetical protein
MRISIIANKRHRQLSLCVSTLLLLAVFSSTGTAQIFNALYEFQGGSDGGGPSGVIRDSAGNLYGTTVTGGIAVYGTVLKLDTSGKKTFFPYWRPPRRSMGLRHIAAQCNRFSPRIAGVSSDVLGLRRSRLTPDGFGSHGRNRHAYGETSTESQPRWAGIPDCAN